MTYKDEKAFHHDCCSHVSLLHHHSMVNVNMSRMLHRFCHTELGEHNEVLRVALWAGDACCAIASLFLVHPTLQTRLVNPFSGTTATARTHPLRRPVVLVRGETHPTAPGTNTYRKQKVSCLDSISDLRSFFSKELLRIVLGCCLRGQLSLEEQDSDTAD